jgi:hypothetical protein
VNHNSASGSEIFFSPMFDILEFCWLAHSCAGCMI